MRTLGLTVVLSLAVLSCAHAQTPIARPGDQLAWSECSKDLPTASAYVYRAYDQTTGTALVPSLPGVTCSGTDPTVTCSDTTETAWECVVTLTTSIVGAFRSLAVQLTAADPTTQAESLKSTPLQFTWSALPPRIPTNPKILKRVS